MTPERARHILDAYGSRSARWPDAEREAVRRLVATDPGLAAYARDAGELDTQFDAFVEGSGRAMPPAWLAGRIMANAPVRRQGGGIWRHFWPLGVAWQPAGALAMSLAVGLWAGAAGHVPEGLPGGGQETATVYSEVDAAFVLYGLSGMTVEEWSYDG